MYTINQLSALKAVFECHSNTACKAYRLICKALKIANSGLALNIDIVDSLSRQLLKYKHLGTEEFVSNVIARIGDEYANGLPVVANGALRMSITP